jgi:Tol biopolymer transport system component
MVTITDSAGPSCSATLAGASGSCILVSNSSGVKSLTLSYGGDDNFIGSSATNTHLVNKANSSVSLVSSLSPALYGQPVTFTATVTAAPPGAGAPTGTVTFGAGHSVLATVVLNASSQATYTTQTLTGGGHQISAIYSGDSNFNGSGPAYFFQAINNIPIVFSSDRDGNLEIYKMNPDGSGVERLTNNNNIDDSPTWSPDHSSIAFARNYGGNLDIYTTNSSYCFGNCLAGPITIDSAPDYQPAWGPGSYFSPPKIAFVSHRDGLSNPEIYVMDPNGINVTRLTYSSSLDAMPAWSPDGTKIAFVSSRDRNYEIYVMNFNGTNVKRLTNVRAIDLSPSWSPDGNKIVFSSNRVSNNNDIYTMNADGSGVTRITTDPGADTQPVWGANGRIVFISDRTGNKEIYTMNADGSVLTQLTFNSATEQSPHW